MIERVEGIVIDVVKHNDSHNVVTLYTRTRGRMAFLVPVGKSKAGKVRNSVLCLMAAVGADVNLRAGKELHLLRKVEPLKLWHGIYANPVKSALLFFLAEFCQKLVRQYPADENLWSFLFNSLECLEHLPSSRVPNFHLSFLIRLLSIVGIEPSPENWTKGDTFDMYAAEMVPVYGRYQAVDFKPGLGGGHRRWLSEEESKYVNVLLRMNYRNMHLFRMSSGDRNRVLDLLLVYYGTHLPVGSEFKTLPVLRELFS